jgi:hypothetical protein
MKIRDIILESQVTGSTIDRLVSIVKDPKLDINLRQSVLGILAQLDAQGEHELAEDVRTPDQIIANIESDEDYFQRLLDSDPKLKAIAERKIKEAEAVAFTAGAALTDKPFEVLKKSVTDAVNALTQIPSTYKEVITKEAVHVVVEGTPVDTVLKFLRDCARPNRIIDLPNIVNRAGSGELAIPREYRTIATKIARLTPGSSNAAMGKGELLLILIGRDTSKATPGDIKVGNLPIEVKASDTSGKSNLSDWVLGKMDTRSARTILVKTVNQAAGRLVFLDKEAKTVNNNVTGISGIGRDTLPVLNEWFKTMGYEKVADMFRKMINVAVGPGFEDNADEVARSISPDGTMDPNRVIPPLKKLVFEFYQEKNKHAGLLALNIANMTYTMSVNGNDFAESPDILVTKIFDFRPVASSILSIKRI